MHPVQSVVVYRLKIVLLSLIVFSTYSCLAQSTYISVGGGVNFRKFCLSDADHVNLETSLTQANLGYFEYNPKKTMTEDLQKIYLQCHAIVKAYEKFAATRSYFGRAGFGCSLSTRVNMELDYVFFLKLATFITISYLKRSQKRPL